MTTNDRGHVTLFRVFLKQQTACGIHEGYLNDGMELDDERGVGLFTIEQVANVLPTCHDDDTLTILECRIVAADVNDEAPDDGPAECMRCGSPVTGDRCSDETCPFSDGGPTECTTCGDPLDINCDGEPYCPACEGPCPCCDDGGGPADDDEPAEGDYVLGPCGPLGGRTGVAVVGSGYLDDFADDDAAEAFVRSRMTAEGFFPNVWTQDDHGGLTPRTLDA